MKNQILLFVLVTNALEANIDFIVDNRSDLELEIELEKLDAWLDSGTIGGCSQVPASEYGTYKGTRLSKQFTFLMRKVGDDYVKVKIEPKTKKSISFHDYTSIPAPGGGYICTKFINISNQQIRFEAIKFRGGREFHTYLKSRYYTPPINFKTNKTYIVTGGLAVNGDGYIVPDDDFKASVS